MSKYTKSDFLVAFFNLVGKKKTTSISVKELSEHAGYSRTAFYKNFKSIDSIIDYFQDKIHDEIYAEITKFKLVDLTPEIIADLLLPIIYHYRSELKISLRYTPSNTWKIYIHDRYYPWFEKQITTHSPQKKLNQNELFFDCFITVCMSVIIDWVESDVPKTIEKEREIFIFYLKHSLWDISQTRLF